MKKGTLLDHEAADALADYYVRKDSPTTMFEIRVKTGATVGEIAKFDNIDVERKVLASRTSAKMKVLLFSAEEWRALRGTEPAAARK